MDSPSTPSSSSSNPDSGGVVSAVTGQLWYNSIVAILMLVASVIALILRLAALLRGNWARRQEVRRAAERQAMEAEAETAETLEGPEIVPAPAPARHFGPQWFRKQEPAVVPASREPLLAPDEDPTPAPRFRPQLNMPTIRVPGWSFRKQKPAEASEVEATADVAEELADAAPSQGFRHRMAHALQQGRERWGRGSATS